MMAERPVGLVAQFITHQSRRMDLWSVTVFTFRHDSRMGSWIMRDEYDVELSKKYGYIFNQSGWGGGKTVSVSGAYFAWGDVEIKEEPTSLVSPTDEPPWCAPETLAIRKRNRTRRIKRLPRAFRGY